MTALNSNRYVSCAFETRRHDRPLVGLILSDEDLRALCLVSDDLVRDMARSVATVVAARNARVLRQLILQDREI